MRGREYLHGSIALLAAAVAGAQAKAPEALAIAMPQDRLADSYAIYSSLIPLGETAGKGWPHDLWLIQDETVTVIEAGQPCAPPANPKEPGPGMNPHTAVQAPPERFQDFREILADFDAHCHDHIQLDPRGWHLGAPVHLLNKDEQAEFEGTRFGKDGPNKDPAIVNKYKGAPGLYGFSQVYFNLPHSVALVYATHWCGGLCGEGFWIALEKNNEGQWRQLHWGGMHWIS